MNIAVILAGGEGQRLGNGIPKQFLKIAGRMVIEHTIDVFQHHSDINEIAVVCHPNYINEVERLCIRNRYSKVKKILSGGKERYHSSLAAIKAYDDPDINILFHDAVRPLVNNRIITECIQKLNDFNAIDVAVPATDTIIQSNDLRIITGIPVRKYLQCGQTPQAFKLGIIKKAYELALTDSKFSSTDDCSVVMNYLPGTEIFIVRGESYNMKLTYKEDIYILDRWFQLKTSNLESKELKTDYKSKLAGKNVVVFGGSSGIGLSIVNMCRYYNANATSFSRSENGVDISDASSVRDALNKVIKQQGRIDYIVNTAGILQREPLADMKLEDVMNSININYLGAVIVAREAFPFIRESRGHILFLTSSSYTRGRSMYSIYSSSKAAIVNLTQALADEWSDFGIKINCINPERTRTPMRIKNFGIEDVNTLLEPEEVARICIKTMLSNISGQVIDVRKKD